MIINLFGNRNKHANIIAEIAYYNRYSKCFGNAYSEGNYLSVQILDSATIDVVDEFLVFAEDNENYLTITSAEELSKRFNDAFTGCREEK